MNLFGVVYHSFWRCMVQALPVADEMVNLCNIKKPHQLWAFYICHVVCYSKSLHHATPNWVLLQWFGCIIWNGLGKRGNILSKKKQKKKRYILDLLCSTWKYCLQNQRYGTFGMTARPCKLREIIGVVIYMYRGCCMIFGSGHSQPWGITYKVLVNGLASG